MKFKPIVSTIWRFLFFLFVLSQGFEAFFIRHFQHSTFIYSHFAFSLFTGKREIEQLNQKQTTTNESHRLQHSTEECRAAIIYRIHIGSQICHWLATMGHPLHRPITRISWNWPAPFQVVLFISIIHHNSGKFECILPFTFRLFAFCCDSFGPKIQLAPFLGWYTFQWRALDTSPFNPFAAFNEPNYCIARLIDVTLFARFEC